MKNKFYLIILLFLSNILSLFSITLDSFSMELHEIIKEKESYTKKKEQKIMTLKDLLKTQKIDQQYDINKNIIEEYEKFQIDSAVSYALKNLRIAQVQHDLNKIYESKLFLALFYSSSGMYIEAKTLLDEMSRKELSSDLLPFYFDVYSKFYANYAQSNKNYAYLQKNEDYRDSLLNVLDNESITFKLLNAENLLYQGQYKIAEKKLLDLTRTLDNRDPQYAIVTYLLGTLYRQNNNIESQKKYYTLSAICDITNATKDNASLQSLALSYFEDGDVDTAYKLIKAAIDDAVFCNVRFRTIEISEFFSMVNTMYLEKENKQKAELKRLLIFTSILIVCLLGAIIYVYKQMKRISRIRKELYRANKKLISLNEDITETNNKLFRVNQLLSEANQVKGEYIAHFFDLCSSYITKLEDYRKTLNKKASQNKLDELYSILKSNRLVENELEDLYQKFDNIFISLYPTFVDDFNSLLNDDGQVQLKQGEILNTELRIFALIRLGITDSVKIASFLRYSLSTIYNYRTKARNKAKVSRDEFENRVMVIGSIQKNR